MSRWFTKCDVYFGYIRGMEINVENLKPYEGDCREKRAQVADMFDNIAPGYDFMNRAMTLGVDKLWRRKAVKMLRAWLGRGTGTVEALDVAAGTADLSLLLARMIARTKVVGVDLSEGMLRLGREKIEKAGLSERITLTQADCLKLPFGDESFDCVTSAFGVRNFQNLLAGYKEMYRVMKPGGTLCVVEMSSPKSAVVKLFYNFYTRHIIPAAGKLVSKDVRAYSYLPESIAAVAQREAMTDLISKAGFTEATYRSLTFGVCTIYMARK